jgi:hypothetical protein
LDEQAAAGAAASLQLAIASLEACGADRFKPARFHYLKSLARRGADRGALVASILTNKALVCLASYRADFSAAQVDAANRAQRLAALDPPESTELQALLENGTFAALRLLEIRRTRSTGSGEIRALVEKLAAGTPTSEHPERFASLAERLRHQEAGIMDSVAQAAGGTLLRERTRGGTTELKSAGYMRESLQEQIARNLAVTARDDALPDSGPLNPQKLVIRSLAKMHDLSPTYLARFVAYVDTLFWLDEQL